MDGLFLYMKNNRIIYKVSIVSILILMLISTMQINPKNEKKNNVGADTELDYTLRYNSNTHRFYKVQGKSAEEMTNEELNELGIELVWPITIFDGKEFRGFILNNANIISTKSVALELIGNVSIQIKDGTTNKIKSSYIPDATGYYGIKADGNILFTGNGKLEVECSNMEESGNKECNAIYASDSCYMDTSAETNITAHAYKHNGIGINVVGKIAVKGGNVIAQGSGQAIKSNSIDFYSGEESHTGAIFVATDIDCNNVEKYSFENISNYKYMELGIIYDYYLKYDSTTGILYKVLDTGKEEKIDFNTIPGLEKSETKNSNGRYTLILDKFNFITSCKYGLYIVLSNASKDGKDKITIEIKNENRIGISNEKVCIRNVIYCDYNTYMDGSGSLDIINIAPDNTGSLSENKGLVMGSYATVEISNISIKFICSGYGYKTNGVAATSIKCNNANIDGKVSGSAKCYGIIGMYDINIVNSNIVLDIKSDEVQGKGIYTSFGTINIKDSYLVVKGNEKSIGGTTTLVSSDDGIDLMLLETSNIYKDEIVDYSEDEIEMFSSLSSLQDYKYVKIGAVPNYYLKYDPVTGNLYKVSSNGSESPLDFNAVPGLDKSDTVNEYGEYTLIMDGFNFVTTAKKGLVIRNTKCWVVEADDTKSHDDYIEGAKHISVIQVVDGSKNRIVVKSQGEEGGLIECNTKMNIIGSGSIDITYDSSNSTSGAPFFGIILGKNNPYQIDNLCKLILTIKNTKININLCGPNSVNKSCQGIYCGKGIYINMDLNINVSNNFFTNGIINYGNGATIFENSNVNIDVKSEAPTWGFGIQSSNIIINNSNFDVRGSKQAFSSLPTSVSDGDYDSAVLCTSKTYKPSTESYTESDLERYPILSADNIRYYKYVQIGQVPNYYYRYKDNTLYKVSKDPSTETPLDSETYPSGCTVVDGKLQLNGFNFITTAPKVIDIVNTDASSETSIEVLGDNNLRNVSSTGEINTICSANNLTIDGTGKLNLINKNNATCRGIYVDNNDDLAKLSVKNISMNINIEGTIAKGIDANVLELNKATTDINVASLSSTVNDCIGICTNGEMRILNSSNITAKTASSATTGYGIYSGGKFSTSASTITAQGKDGAIYLAIADNDFDTSTVKGSNNYDGTVSKDVMLSKANCTTYQYVLIKYVKVISVDISWGNMDYKYTEGNWNSSNHTYDLGTWAPISEGGDKITVINNSNVSINANINYIPETAYSSIIGTIKRDNGSPLENITSSQNIIKNGKLDALLVLDGRLLQGSNGVKIGEVKVTITE